MNYVELKKAVDYDKICNIKHFALLFFNAGGKSMPNVFEKKSTEELYVQLSDGRMMTLEDLVMDYERLLKEEDSKKEATTFEPKDDSSTESEPKDDKSATSESRGNKPIVPELKVGEWFRIDRDVINKSQEEIRRKCNEAGEEGKAYWKRFEASNKIADENPDQYPRLIKTYIFEHSWEYKTEQEMREMCEEVGDGMCDEVICDLELQMRICNGELVDDLVKKADKLPYVRVTRLRNGGTGFFGGGAAYNFNCPPANLYRGSFSPVRKNSNTPYAFRRVFA